MHRLGGIVKVNNVDFNVVDDPYSSSAVSGRLIKLAFAWMELAPPQHNPFAHSTSFSLLFPRLERIISLPSRDIVERNWQEVTSCSGGCDLFLVSRLCLCNSSEIDCGTPMNAGNTKFGKKKCFEVDWIFLGKLEDLFEVWDFLRDFVCRKQWTFLAIHSVFMGWITCKILQVWGK